ncbi:MAG: hypothetical protein ACLQUT_05540 [Thermoleophilia bacterium]
MVSSASPSKGKSMSATATKICFNTREFEIDHARSPKGRGSWAFATDPNSSDYDAMCWTPGMTYTEAKRYATTWARERNIKTLYVMP